MASPRASRAPGRRKIGFEDPISAYTGIGSGRIAAASKSVRPARSDPVKPAARMRGCVTSVMPISGAAPCTMEKTPSGIRVSRAAVRRASAASSEVPGCAGCALTTTGQPAARAETVSPPATENASGKLDAPKTATGPIGTSSRRRSGRGCGLRSGSARSIRASDPRALLEQARKEENLATRRAPLSSRAGGSGPARAVEQRSPSDRMLCMLKEPARRIGRSDANALARSAARAAASISPIELAALPSSRAGRGFRGRSRTDRSRA